MLYYQDSFLRQNPTDPSKVRLLCTLYVQKQPAMVAERNRLKTYVAAKQWVDADEALDFKIDLSKIVEVRRGAFAGASGVATYKRPDSVASVEQFSDALEVSMNQAKLGRLVVTNAGLVPARDGSSYKKTRLHTTAGDLPSKMLDSVLSQAESPLDVLLAARDYFDRVAACRAIGATSALSHPILIWKDEVNGSYHWYARGYDAICFSLFGNALSTFDSEGKAYASPLLVDCSVYSPYEGLQYDVSFVSRASEAELNNGSFVSTGASISDVVRGALAIGLDVLDEFGAYSHPATGVAHRQLIDPYGLTDSDCSALVLKHAELAANTLPETVDELAQRLASDDIPAADLDLSQEVSHEDAIDLAEADEALQRKVAKTFNRSVESLKGWYLRLKGSARSSLAKAWGSARNGLSKRVDQAIALTSKFVAGDSTFDHTDVDPDGYVASVAYDPTDEIESNGGVSGDKKFRFGVNRLVHA